MAEETFNDGHWVTEGTAFWINPKSTTGGDCPAQRCTQDRAQTVMTEMHIYHWVPAACHANGGTWTMMRNLLEDDEAVDQYFNAERARDQRR
eukprot:955667-Pyramimonas_sp.AAC.1